MTFQGLPPERREGPCKIHAGNGVTARNLLCSFCSGGTKTALDGEGLGKKSALEVISRKVPAGLSLGGEGVTRHYVSCHLPSVLIFGLVFIFGDLLHSKFLVADRSLVCCRVKFWGVILGEKCVGKDLGIGPRKD